MIWEDLLGLINGGPKRTTIERFTGPRRQGRWIVFKVQVNPLTGTLYNTRVYAGILHRNPYDIRTWTSDDGRLFGVEAARLVNLPKNLEG